MANNAVYLDVETQNGPDDVPGGWSNAAAFKCSCVVTCTEGMEDPNYRTWWEPAVPERIDHVSQHDLIVGFNIKRFDYAALSAYGKVDHLFNKTVDLLEMIYSKLGFRISLQSLAETNLGLGKLGTGAQAIEWWRKGDLERLERYGQENVRITRLLYQKIVSDGYLLYDDKRAGELCRVRLKIPVGLA